VDEFVRLLEFLDEDQVLNGREMGEAVEGYMEMSWAGQPNDDLIQWLSNVVTSAAQDDNDFGDDTIDESHFVTLATKLGVTEADARAAFADKDVNGNGRLSLSEQDEIWQ